MSQRKSGYRRQKLDDYQTREAWVTEALIDVLPVRVHTVWEPAAGQGFMVQVLRDHQLKVYATDIRGKHGRDFLKIKKAPKGTDAIITNPPYSQAVEFIEHAMKLAAPEGIVCMLLRCDWDHAKTRQHLFGRCPQFFRKLVLTKRINWFEHRIASPSFNHAWYIWNMRAGTAEPTIHYGP